MALKDVFKTMKADTVLIGELDRHLLKPSKGSGYVKDDRETGCWHVSSLAGCIRSLMLSRLGVRGADKISAQSTRIFDVGHHFGYILQEYLYDMGILYGEWKCKHCGERWTDLFENPSPSVCPHCGKPIRIWESVDYLEVPVVDEEHNVMGHADGLIKTQGCYRIVEFKSIKNRDAKTSPQAVTFNDLSQPKDDHRWQVQYYTWVLSKVAEEQGYRLDDCLVLYMAKNTQELKEYPMKLMEQLYVQPQIEKLNVLNAMLAEGEIPAKPEGQDCRWCGYREVCKALDEGKSLEEIQPSE